jgi:HlyD family secretion protein
LVQLLPTDPTLLDARSLAESEARVQAAEAAQAESDAMLISAREEAALARDQYERALKLHNGNAISEAEFDEAEHHHRMTEASLRSAEFRSKVKHYEKELARAALTLIADAKDVGFVSTIRIASPIDGRVLRVLHEDSSVVTAGTPILEIGDPQDLEMRIDVLSTDAVAIEAGAKVMIEHWGGGQPLHGTVRIVEPSAFLKISALGVEEKRVNVIADFVEPWAERKTLGDGYRIEARIVTHATDDHSLKIAAGTLFRHEDDWHVYRIRNERVELVRVRVGASNGLETEILEGVVEGDRLILHPTDQIRPGIMVLHS